MMKTSNLDQPSTKRDIEEAIAQIVAAVNKTLETKADKKDLEKLATKEELKAQLQEVNHKVDNLSTLVSDTRRRVIDLEHDTPTVGEFDELKKHVGLR